MQFDSYPAILLTRGFGQWIHGDQFHNGDGIIDLLVQDLSAAAPTVETWSYVADRFALIAAWAGDPLLTPYWITPSRAGRAWIWWASPLENEYARWLATDIDGEPTQPEIELTRPLHLLRFVGDLTDAGAMEMITATRQVFEEAQVFQGLQVWREEEAGGRVVQPWYEEMVWLRDRVWA